MNNLLKYKWYKSSKLKFYFFVISLLVLCQIYFEQMEDFYLFSGNSQEDPEKKFLEVIEDPETDSRKLEEINKYFRYEKVKEGIANVRNVPEYEYVSGAKGQTFLDNSSCAPFLTLFDIRFTNVYWQTQSATNWTFHIFGAYWDERKLNEGGPSIRILGIVDREIKNVTAYCQVWFQKEREPKIFEVDKPDVSWGYSVPKHRKYNGAVPYLWNCPLSLEDNATIPTSVSVVENICDQATTNVKIHFEKPKNKNKVAICVRAMNFPYTDISTSLIEWLEIVKIFGAHKVFLCTQNVHPNITKVLDYYNKSGFVDMAATSFPGGIPNEISLSKAYDLAGGFQAFMTEIVPLNDCLYRNLYNYDYLAVIDIDEIFVSGEFDSWLELLDYLQNEFGNTSSVTSFVFQNTIFHPEIKLASKTIKKLGIPPFLNMLQEVHSCEREPGSGAKCFHNPLRVKIMHNHYPFGCLGGCHYVDVNASVAHCHHYRLGYLKKKECENQTTITDTTLWKWKKKIIENASTVLKKLNFI